MTEFTEISESARPAPLAGKRVVITRARHQAGALRELLEKRGAEVIEVPSIEIRPPESWAPFDAALHHLREFDYLIATSANGVEALRARLRSLGLGIEQLKHLRIGAIGPATARAFSNTGITVHFVPSDYRAEGLLAALAGEDIQGKSFLIPRARVARDLLPDALRARGARVEVVEAYQTVRPRFRPGELERLLAPPPDIVAFTSSSTARHFTALISGHHLREKLAGAAIASIGPITSGTLRSLDWTVSVEPAEFTVPALAAAIEAYFSRLP